MPKIAFIHNNFPSGGAERVTIDIARYLSSFEGYRVYVLATRISDGGYGDFITTCRIPSQMDMSRRSRAIEKCIVREGIDILVEVSKSVRDIAGIRRRTGVKVVFACHGAPFWQQYMIQYRRQRNAFLWHLIYRRRFGDGTRALQMARSRTCADYEGCDVYTVLCGQYKVQLEREFGIDASASKIRVIENSEKLVQNVNLDKEKIVLYCGRLENWHKRVDRLLRIWAKVQDGMSDWRLVIVGGGKDREMLEKLSADLRLKRVCFEGPTREPWLYYGRASVVALTSQFEGWPLVLSEAQANGCICVAFDCVAGVEGCMGESGKTGFLVPSFDEDAFARALLDVSAMDAQAQKEIRLNALKWRESFTPDKIASKWKQLFDDII